MNTRKFTRHITGRNKGICASQVINAAFYALGIWKTQKEAQAGSYSSMNEYSNSRREQNESK